MTYADFVQQLKAPPAEIRERVANMTDAEIDLLHGAMGLALESAEILKIAYRHVFYGDLINPVNLYLELGDMEFFAELIRSAKFSHDVRDDILAANMRKLRARHGDKFSAKRAVNRDVEAERKAVEGE